MPAEVREDSLAAVVALCLAFALLLAFQGGYYAGATCAVAVPFVVAYALFSAFVLKGAAVFWPTLFLGGIGCLCLLSSVVAGPSLSMLSYSASWFAVAGVLLWLGALSSSGVRSLVKAIAWGGVVLAAVGVLMVPGVFPVEGSLSAGRLQFFFQYANTAGIFFAAAALISGFSEDRSSAVFLQLPVLALLLTESVGSMILFFAAFAAMEVLSARRGSYELVSENLLSFVLAAAAFVAGRLLGDAALVCAAVLCCALMVLYRRSSVRSRLSCRKAAVFLAALLVLAVLLAVFVLLPQRIEQAGQTFVERGIQIFDAGRLFAGNLLLGIGPDAWSFEFPFHQSAQYQAASVHCSYLQIALDAGVGALALFIAFAAVGLFGLFKKRDYVRLAAAVAILLHMLVDFDGQFSSMLVLLAVLLYAGSEPAFRLEGRLPVLAGSLLLALICVFGTSLDLRKQDEGSLEAAVQMLPGVVDADAADDAGDAGAAVGELSLLDSLAANDVGVVTARYAALLAEGRFSDVVRLFECSGVSNDEQARSVVQALLVLGESRQAGDLLLAELEKQPYNADFYEYAGRVLASADVDASVLGAYNDLVDAANALAQQGAAAFLHNQEMIDRVS